MSEGGVERAIGVEAYDGGEGCAAPRVVWILNIPGDDDLAAALEGELATGEPTNGAAAGEEDLPGVVGAKGGIELALGGEAHDERLGIFVG